MVIAVQFASEVEMAYFSNQETEPSSDDLFFGFDVNNRPSTARMEFISSYPKNPDLVTDSVSRFSTSGLVKNSEQCREPESNERCVVDIIDGIEIEQFKSEVDLEFHINHEAVPSLDEPFAGFDVKKRPSSVVMDFFISKVKKQHQNVDLEFHINHEAVPSPDEPFFGFDVGNEVEDDDCVIVSDDIALPKPYICPNSWKRVNKNTIKKKPLNKNTIKKKPLNKNSREKKTLNMNTREKTPLNKNTREKKPLNKNTTKKKPLNKNTIKNKPLVLVGIIPPDSDEEDTFSTSNSSYGCSTTANVDNSNRISENLTATNICTTNNNSNYVESKEGSNHNITSYRKNSCFKRTNIDNYTNSRTEICDNVNSQKGYSNFKKAQIDNHNLFLINHNVKTQAGANHIATKNNRTLENHLTTNISRTNVSSKKGLYSCRNLSCPMGCICHSAKMDYKRKRSCALKCRNKNQAKSANRDCCVNCEVSFPTELVPDQRRKVKSKLKSSNIQCKPFSEGPKKIIL